MKTKNFKFKSMALVLFALVLSSNVWGANPTITLTASSLDMDGSYGTNETGTVDDITFSYTDLMKNSNNIQAKASSGEIHNTTAIPGNIISVAVTHSGTARSTTISFGTTAECGSESTTWSGTETISPSGDYTYFKITRGSNAAYWTSIVITYEETSSKTETVTSFGAGVDDQTFAAEVGGTFATKTATVKANGSAVAGATVTYSSSTPAVASVNASTGAITINAKGTTDITATYEGDATYASSSAKYTINVTNPNEVVLWSEDWSDGTDGYTLINGGSDTKLYNETLAGGTSPELLVGKNTGSMTTPTISLAESTSPYVLTFKSNKSGLTVSSATMGVSVGEVSLVSGSTYTCTITVPANTPSITLTFFNTLGENARLDDMELVGTAASCTKKITITKGAPSNGTFNLSQTGEVCIDEGNATVDVTDIQPAEHYHFSQITATNGSVDNENKRVTNISVNTTINVEFAEDTKYTISFLDNIQLEDVEDIEVYDGATFIFPVLTDRTAATEGTCEQVHYHFMGWVISTHTGEIAVGDIKTGTSGAVYAPATYKAVWAAEEQ
ncbi:MAG: hypothetical protein MJZ79_07040 [Paludibacteraceae bacterium]|nr:hypothetical protein [Paludibacteraceae bacterium]